MSYENLGKIIGEARKSKGFTQSGIAEMLKVTAQNVSSWERGKSKIDVDNLVFLCELYGLNVAKTLKIFSNTTQENDSLTLLKSEPSTDKNLQKYPFLNEAGRTQVKGYIDGLLESRDYQLNLEPEEEIGIEVTGASPTISIDFYDAPVSAGLGEMLMDEEKTQILVPDTPTTRQADFCLRVKGDSMEPKYFDGDLVFVESREAIEEGQIGIFVFDGEAYIKKYTHEGLVSLNKKYDDILPDEETRVYCFGRVIGKI